MGDFLRAAIHLPVRLLLLAKNSPRNGRVLDGFSGACKMGGDSPGFAMSNLKSHLRQRTSWLCFAELSGRHAIPFSPRLSFQLGGDMTQLATDHGFVAQEFVFVPVIWRWQKQMIYHRIHFGTTQLRIFQLDRS